MNRRFFFISIAIALTVPTAMVMLSEPVYSACDPGEKIDASTAADARRRIEAAGYQKVKNLKKGCDNYWHAQAEKDGKPVFVVLSPHGEVMQEGD